MLYRYFAYNHIIEKHFGVGTILALFLLGLLTPLVFYPFGIAGDYPNHYVAFGIAFERLQNAQPHSFYQVDWHLFPHLAMAVLAVPVLLGIEIPMAFHLFLVASAAMPVIGAWAIHRQIYRTTSWSFLLSLVLVYNSCLYMGFLDFNLSLGLAFCLFALSLRQEERPTISNCLFLAFGAAALFLIHLLGFLIFSLLIASQQIQKFMTPSEYCLKITSLLAPLVWLWPTAILAIIWLINGPETLPQEKMSFGLPHLSLLFRAFWGPFYFSHNLPAITLVPLFIVLFPCAVLTRILTTEKKYFFSLGVLLVTTVLLSQRVGGVALDFRLGMATFLFASAVVSVESLDNFLKRAIVTISILFFFCGLILQCFLAWPKIQETHYETLAIRQALHKLPTQSRLLAGSNAESRNFLHTGAFVAFDRDGFFPQLFQVVHPVRAHKLFASINMPGMEMSSERLLAGIGKPPVEVKDDSWFNLEGHQGWPLRFDYLIWFSTTEGPMVNYDFLEKVDEGKHFRLYRILVNKVNSD